MDRIFIIYHMMYLLMLFAITVSIRSPHPQPPPKKKIHLFSRVELLDACHGYRSKSLLVFKHRDVNDVEQGCSF